MNALRISLGLVFLSNVRPTLMFMCLAVLLSACKKENGITDSDPVFDAQSQKNKLDRKTLSKLKKTNSSSGNSEQLVRPNFVNVATEYGLSFSLFRDQVKDRFFFPEVMGGGLAWIDYDLDGWVDLYAGNGDSLVSGASGNSNLHLNQVFRNLQGTSFENSTMNCSPDGNGFSQGLSVGDVNADGFPDLFVANVGQNYLLINQGDGSFVRFEVGQSDVEPLWKTGAVMADLDQDGDLDVFVTCYVDWTPENHHPCIYKGTTGYCGPGTYKGTKDLLYENLGDGTYREVHHDAGIDFDSKGLVVCAADFDHDRKLELYVGSDLTENAFYVRDGKGLLFKNQANKSGVASSKNGQAEATMGISISDFDSNGEFDLFLTHYFQDKNTLYLNRGKLTFDDASYESRIKALSFDYIGFGTSPLDYDHDGDFDLFISNGHVLGEHISPFKFKPQLLNNNDGRFFDVGQSSGYFANEFVGRSAAQCDFNNDGRVDIAVGHLDSPIALLRNDLNTENHFFQLQLQDHRRRDLTGTEVVVRFNGIERHMQVVAGESYLSSRDPRLNIGVGDAETAGLVVHWPWGETSQHDELSADTMWLLSSGASPIQISTKNHSDLQEQSH